MALTAVPASPTRENLDSTLAAVEDLPASSRQGGKRGSTLHCSFVYRVDRIEGDQVKRVWVPCGRRICAWCSEQRCELDARRYAAAFYATGAKVHLDVFDSRDKATNAVRYATRLGHPAIAVPLANGTVWLFTTQPRRGAEEVTGELVELLDLALSQVPAYTRDEGRATLVVPNQALAALTMDAEEFRRRETAQVGGFDYRDKPVSASPAVLATENWDVMVENLGLVTERDKWGRIKTYRIPAPAEGLVARAFWCGFGELHELTRPVAA